MKRLELTHTVLYFKGWYKTTGDIIEDLKLTLQADGYMPSNKNDVMLSLVARMEDAEHHRMSAFDVLNALKMKRFRRVMFEKENDSFSYEDLVIDYMAELMVGLDNKQWNVGMPDYSILPMPEHHNENSAKDAFERFNNTLIKN